MGSTHSDSDAFGSRVRNAVMWRSGAQIVAQIISWGSTLAVVRILDPHDYGLFAMTSVVLAFLNFLSGYGFASSLVQAETVSKTEIRQIFGILLLLNAGLACIQLTIAPLAAAYYDQPEIGQMLRWQALIYLATPFTIVPEVLMTRNLQFTKPAIINIIATALGATTAITCALNGLGVWTLVYAPIVIFWSKAILTTTLTRFFVWPSFDFRGAGHMVTFGTTLLISHGLWIIQSQSDVFIAGRHFNPHDLGLYAEALFLTQIFATKFVPPLNEVAFPAYARLQHDKQALAWSFLKAVRLILIISCPLYLGLAITAPVAVETLFGPKWLEMVPYVRVLAFAMPLVTLQIIFSPALNALGKPFINARISACGAILMPTTYLIAVQYGPVGLAYGWVFSFSILAIITFLSARKVIGVSAMDVIHAIRPGLIAAIVMAAFVALILDNLATHIAAPLRFLILAASGAIIYASLLRLFTPVVFAEVLDLVIRRKAPDARPI